MKRIIRRCFRRVFGRLMLTEAQHITRDKKYFALAFIKRCDSEMRNSCNYAVQDHAEREKQKAEDWLERLVKHERRLQNVKRGRPIFGE